MKKLIAATFSILLMMVSFVACSNGTTQQESSAIPPSSKEAEASLEEQFAELGLWDLFSFPATPETEYVRFLDTDWGMTPEETVLTLGTTISDWEQSEEENRMLLVKKEFMFEKIPCLISLQFSSVQGGTGNKTLSEVRIISANAQDANKLIVMLNQQYAPTPAVSIESGGVFHQGKPQYLYYTKETWNNYLRHYYNLASINDREKGLASMMKQTGEQPITCISLSSMKGDAGEQYIVRFIGSKVAFLKEMQQQGMS